jgi:hypothetical protein
VCDCTGHHRLDDAARFSHPGEKIDEKRDEHRLMLNEYFHVKVAQSALCEAMAAHVI